MTAAIAIFIQYLPQLIQAGGAIAEYVQKQRATWQHSGEWNDEAEQAYTAALAELKGPNKPHAFKTDPELEAEGD